MRFDHGETELGGSAPIAQVNGAPVNESFQVTGRQALLCALSIVLGLYVDQKIELWGQLATSVAVWVVMLRFMHHARGDLRVLVLACLAWSTFGEIIGSLVWGLYTYRLFNVPAFVPPGHVLMLLLALFLAERYRRWVLVAAPAIALTYGLYALVNRIDLVSVMLTPILIATLIFARKRHIYAATFLAVIPLELYGTWMGNWRWDSIAPGLDLSMANPPICIGAVYCARDTLSALTVEWRKRWQRRNREETMAAAPALSAQGSAISTS
jgi:hypothetical protein